MALDQVLVVDDAHLQMQSPGKPDPPFYTIDAAQTLVLDASAYKFSVPSQLSGKPIDLVQVVLANDEIYSARWSDSLRRRTLSSHTLTPSPGSKPFSGFRSGQQGIVAIGTGTAR